MTNIKLSYIRFTKFRQTLYGSVPKHGSSMKQTNNKKELQNSIIENRNPNSRLNEYDLFNVYQWKEKSYTNHNNKSII